MHSFLLSRGNYNGQHFNCKPILQPTNLYGCHSCYVAHRYWTEHNISNSKRTLALDSLPEIVLVHFWLLNISILVEGYWQKEHLVCSDD